MKPTPSLNLGTHSHPAADLDALLMAARTAYANRNIRQTADHLCAAESLANHTGQHAKAAQLRKAKTILSTGGKPRLLTQASLWPHPREK